MVAEIRHLANSDGAIRLLHAELERLASIASGAYVSRTPIRIECSGKDKIQYWHDEHGIQVLTAGGTVHLSTTLEFHGDSPDWHALRNREIRQLANALLSAAAYVDDGEEGE